MNTLPRKCQGSLFTNPFLVKPTLDALSGTCIEYEIWSIRWERSVVCKTYVEYSGAGISYLCKKGAKSRIVAREIVARKKRS